MSTKRWLVEGDDCAVLARAINSGVVTDDLKTFKDFFDPSSSGPGAEIGEKYGYSTQKGQRNLKTNWRKLLRKIQLWRSNHKDPDTGKRKSIAHIILYCSYLISHLSIPSCSILGKFSKEGKISCSARFAFGHCKRKST